MAADRQPLLSARCVVIVLLLMFILQTVTMLHLYLQVDLGAAGTAATPVALAGRSARQGATGEAAPPRYRRSSLSAAGASSLSERQQRLARAASTHDHGQGAETGPLGRLTIFSVLKDMDQHDVPAECRLTTSVLDGAGATRGEQPAPEDAGSGDGAGRRAGGGQRRAAGAAVVSETRCNLTDFAAWMDTRVARNALVSWLLLPNVDVILFGAPSACRFVQDAVLPLVPAAQRVHLHCEPPPCVHAQYGAPTYDCMFARVRDLAETEWIMYTNADVIYFPDLVELVEDVQRRFARFAIVGKRTDLWLPLSLAFDNTSWAAELRTMAGLYGSLHGKYGIDYFVFHRDAFPTMLPFLVGRVRWDNWLLAQFIRDPAVTTIDATEAVLAVHQLHGRTGASAKREGSTYNIELTQGDAVDPKKVGDIEQTDMRVTLARRPRLKTDALAFVSDPDARLTRPLNVATGACASEQCVLSRLVPPLTAVLYRQQRNRLVVVASVGPDQVDLALNWVCHMDRLGLGMYLLHTADQGVLQHLLQLGLPAVQLSSPYGYRLASTRAPTGGNVWATPAHEAQLGGRIDLAAQILMAGIDVLLWDLDAIPLGNPVPALDPTADVVSRINTASDFGRPGQVVYVALGKNKRPLSAGFLYLRATERTKQYIFRVKIAHERLLEAVAAAIAKGRGWQAPAPSFEDQAFTTGLQGDNLAVKHLPATIVADRMIFARRGELARGEWPLVVYHNDIPSVADRVLELKRAGVWLLAERAAVCRASAFPLPLRPAPSEVIGHVRTTGLVLTVVVHVTPEHTGADVRALLASLARADYTGATGTASRHTDAQPSSAARWRLGGTGGDVTFARDQLQLQQQQQHQQRRRRGQNAAILLNKLRLESLLAGDDEEDGSDGDGDGDYGSSSTAADDDDDKAGSVWMGWHEVRVRVFAPATHGDIADVRAIVGEIDAMWAEGAVRLFELSTPADLTRTAVAWLPSVQREIGLFIEPGHVVLPHYASALLVLAAEYYFSGAAAPFDAHLLGVSLLSRPQDVPFEDTKSAMKRVDDTWAYRYQRVTPSGTAIFGQHYAEFLTWHFRELRALDDPLLTAAAAAAAASPTTAPPPPPIITERSLAERLERYMVDRGLYAVYAGPRLGALVVPVSEAARPGPDPLTLRGALPALPDLLLLDAQSVRVLPQQVIESRGLLGSVRSP